MNKVSFVLTIAMMIAISIVFNRVLNEAPITGRVATNQSGAVVNITILETPETPIFGSRGAGASGPTEVDVDIITIPDSLYIKTTKNLISQQLTVKNIGDLTSRFMVSSTLSAEINEKEFTLSPNEEKVIYLKFKLIKPGIYTGLIEINSDFITKYIPVIIEYSSETDFRVELELPEEYKQVKSGDGLLLKIKLLDLYGITDIDYIVKDSKNRFVLKEHEVININERYIFDKTLKLPKLKLGTYAAGIIVVNNRKTAVDSELFKVVKIKEPVREEPKITVNEKNYLLAFLIILLLITAIIYYAKKKS